MTTAAPTRPRPTKKKAWYEELGLNILTLNDLTEITPEIAIAFLARNTHNRPISQGTLEKYVAAMERDEFMPNGDAIVFDENDNLLNGQHRLTAIVETGIPQRMFVVMGLPAETQETMDTGKGRNLGDMLALRHEANSALLAAAIRSTFAWEATGIPNARNVPFNPTMPQFFECLERHPALRTAITFMGSSTYRPWFISQAQAAAIYHIFSLYNEDDAAEFFRLLSSGEGLEFGDPILTLREKLQKVKSDRNARLTDTPALAYIFRAFNGWRQGERLTKLQWKPGGSQADSFPQIVAMDGDNEPPVQPGKLFAEEAE